MRRQQRRRKEAQQQHEARTFVLCVCATQMFSFRSAGDNVSFDELVPLFQGAKHGKLEWQAEAIASLEEAAGPETAEDAKGSEAPAAA